MAFYLVVDILTIKHAPLVHVDIHLTYSLHGMKVLLWLLLYLSWCGHDDMGLRLAVPASSNEHKYIW